MLPKLLSCLCVIIILVHAQNQQQPSITLHKWLSTTNDSWPEQEGKPTEPFYVFHGEGVTNPIFGFNKDLYRTRKLITRPSLSFKYWTDTDSGLFRYKYTKSNQQHHLDVQLNQTYQWKSVQMNSIPQEEWEQFKYDNADDRFTIAFKELQVKFTDKISTQTVPSDPLTGYKGSNHLENVNKLSTNDSTKLWNLLSVHSRNANITLDQDFKFDRNTKNSLAFDIQTIPVTQPKPLKIILTNHDNKECAVQVYQNGNLLPNSSNVVIKCQFGSRKDYETKLPYKTLRSFTLELIENGIEAFVLWYPKDFRGLLKDDSENQFGDVYAVASSVAVPAYVNLIDSQPKNQSLDICYSLIVPKHSQPIEIYFTYPHSPRGQHLTTLIESQTFCLNHFIALRNFQLFQLTLFVEHPIERFAFALGRTEVTGTESFNLKQPNNHTRSGVTQGWYYFNSVFDYRIRQTLNQKAHFWACDILANCFPYSMDDPNSKIYSLSQDYLAELSHSPFIRIKSDSSAELFSFESANSQTKFLELLERDIQQANQITIKTNPTVTSEFLEFCEALNRQTNFTFSVPINHVDLRIFQLVIQTKPFSDQDDGANLLKLTFTHEEDGKVHDFSEIFLEKELRTNHLEISTQDFFNVGKFSSNSMVKGFFSFTLGPIEPKYSQTFELSIKLRLEALNLKANTLPYIIKPIKELRILNPVLDPVVMIFSGLLKAPGNQQIPNYRIQFRLSSESPFSSSDISVTQLITSHGRVERFSKANLLKFNANSMEVILNDTKDEKVDAVKLEGETFELIYRFELKNAEHGQVYIDLDEFVILEEEKIDSKAGPVVAGFDPKYDSFECPVNFKMSDDKKSCQLEHLYQESTIDCTTLNCSSIFDTSLIRSTKYFNSKAQTDYFPYQVKSLDPLSLYLQIIKPENLDKNKDYCIYFYYKSKESTLLISSVLSTETYQIEYPIGEQETRICASWFSPDPNGVNDFYFRFSKIPLLDIDNHFIRILETKSEITQNTRNEGLYLGKMSFDSFLGPIDKRFVIQTKEQEDNLVTYQVLNLDKIKRDNPNGLLMSNLRIVWFKVPPTRKDLFRLTFIPDKKTSDFDKDFYRVQLILNSPNGQLINRSLSDLNASVLHIFNLSSVVVAFYQLTIQIQLDLSKVKSESNFTLNFSQFTINDPCWTDDSGTLQTCSNKHGECIRNYEAFNSTCKCQDEYLGEYCERDNYCKQKIKNRNLMSKSSLVWNEDVCTDKRLKRCLNDYVLETFKCECLGKDEQWDTNLAICIKTSSIICTEHEIIQLVSNQPECTCMEGYIRLPNNRTQCTQYNPCSENHRKVNQGTMNRACQNPNTECKVRQENSMEFECKCRDGFYNEFGLKDSTAKCIPNICKSCDHYCEKNSNNPVEYECQCAKGYTKDSNKCILNSTIDLNLCLEPNSTAPEEGFPKPFLNDKTCECADGFTFNSTGKFCEINQKLATQSFGCAQIEIKSDKQLGCTCASGQKFDPETRKCLNECSVEKVKECANRKSFCLYKNGRTNCKCKDDEIAFAPNAQKPTEWDCLSKCDLLDLEENKDKKCMEQFQTCNPAKFTFDSQTGKQNLFIFNQSQIISQDHCDCEIGFSSSDGQCLPSDVPIRYIEGMEFETQSSAPDSVNKIETAFVLLLTRTLKVGVIAHGTKCSKGSQTRITCDATLQTKQSEQTIRDKLKSACIVFGAEKHECMFVIPKITDISKRTKRSVLENDEQVASGSNFESILVVPDANKTVNVLSMDYCSKPNRCRAQYENTICKPKWIPTDSLNLFECLCDLNLFTLQSTSHLNISRHSLRMQTCKLKDLCTEQQNKYGCSDPSAQCHLSVEFINSSYVPESYCSCPKTGLVLSSRSANCTNTCNGYCRNGDCVQDVLNPTKMVCHCADGFTGERCDKKEHEIGSTNDSGSSANAFKIATIALAVVLGLALLALGFMLLQRYSKWNRYNFGSSQSEARPPER